MLKYIDLKTYFLNNIVDRLFKTADENAKPFVVCAEYMLYRPMRSAVWSNVNISDVDGECSKILVRHHKTHVSDGPLVINLADML